MEKVALITGITGQDGAYLTEFLLNRGYTVYGTYRRTSSVNFWRLDELNITSHPKLNLIEFDITDLGTCIRAIEKCRPQEIYNLAAQSYVGVSFEQPTVTAEITGIGALNLLEAIRIVNKDIKFYQASTSEMFGKVQEIPQRETTIFYPRSPYGVAKLYAHWMTINYRESYNIFACSGILFNHESPLRGKEFVTRKITDGLAKISLGKQRILELGNLEAKRDWGYAKDFVEGMYLMLQASNPDTFVLATGREASVRDFVNLTALGLGIEIIWKGENENEIGIDASTGKTIVKVNPDFYRPTEVETLLGDPSKAREELSWKTTTSLETLCQMMVNSDVARNSD